MVCIPNPGEPHILTEKSAYTAFASIHFVSVAMLVSTQSLQNACTLNDKEHEDTNKIRIEAKKKYCKV